MSTQYVVHSTTIEPRIFETLFETEDQFLLNVKNLQTLDFTQVYESALKLNHGSLLRYIFLSIEHSEKSLFDIYHQAFTESTKEHELEVFLKTKPSEKWTEHNVTRCARRVNVTILSHFLQHSYPDKTVHRGLDYLMSKADCVAADLLYQTMNIFSNDADTFHSEETVLLYLFSKKIQPIEKNYFSFLVSIREYKPQLYLPLLEQFDKYAQLWQNFTLHSTLSHTLSEKKEDKKLKI